MKNEPWTIAEETRLRREFPYKTNAELARAFGRSQQALCVKASKMGLKKDHYGIVWTKLQLDTLRRFFPTMFNADLAKLIGVSQRTMSRKARELGLEKSATFREDRKRDINRRASEALKNKYQQGSCISHFKKGVRSNPDGEFKPGHVESQETKLKRSEALKYTWKQKKIKERIHKIYGI